MNLTDKLIARFEELVKEEKGEAVAAEGDIATQLYHQGRANAFEAAAWTVRQYSLQAVIDSMEATSND
jgi:hypothetical protein